MAASRYDKLLERPIIFIGNPRSGTTVISEIILRHRHLAFPSQYQNKFTDKAAVNWLRRFFDNGLWRVHGQKKQLNRVSPFNRYTFRPVEAYPMWNSISGDDIDFSRDFLLNTRAEPDRIPFIRDYFGKMVLFQGKKRLSFKITGPARMEYLNSIFPDALFVRIIRKPVPTISSLLKVSFWKDRGYNQLWWTGAYSDAELKWAEQHKEDPVALTAFQIKRIFDETDGEIRKVKPGLIEVHYSDFVSEPEKTIEQIMDFIGLDSDPACMDYLKKNRIYNQNKPNSEYLSAEDLNKVDEIMKPKQQTQ